MEVIDAHQHFWHYSHDTHAWINDEMALLKRDFLPDGLQVIYQQNDITGCVAVQAEQSERETDFLLNLASGYDFIKGVVGWVDLCAENIEERLHFYSQFPKLKGFRHIVQDEPDDNFMLGDAFQYGLSLLQKFGFTYDILIFPKQLPAALQTVEKFPELRCVVDHIAKPFIKKGTTPGWEKYMRELASHSNVFCKVSGMVTEADWQNWNQGDFEPWMDVVFDAFGAERMMFGSDWPVCLLAGTYERVKGIVAQYIDRLSEAEKTAIWGGNARKFYRLK
jgi:L-fuconolactonase